MQLLVVPLPIPIMIPPWSHLSPVENLVHLRHRVSPQGRDVPSRQDSVLQPRVPRQSLREQCLTGSWGTCNHKTKKNIFGLGKAKTSVHS